MYISFLFPLVFILIQLHVHSLACSNLSQNKQIYDFLLKTQGECQCQKFTYTCEKSIWPSNVLNWCHKALYWSIWMTFHQSFEKCIILTPCIWKQPQLRITLMGRLRPWMITRGSHVHKPIVKFLGASWKFIFANFSKYWWIQTKQFTMLLEFIKPIG